VGIELATWSNTAYKAPLRKREYFFRSDRQTSISKPTPNQIAPKYRIRLLRRGSR